MLLWKIFCLDEGSPLFPVLMQSITTPVYTTTLYIRPSGPPKCVCVCLSTYKYKIQSYGNHFITQINIDPLSLSLSPPLLSYLLQPFPLSVLFLDTFGSVEISLIGLYIFINVLMAVWKISCGTNCQLLRYFPNSRWMKLQLR